MDPVSLIVGAVGVGGAAGVEDTASTAAKPDRSSEELVRHCVAGRPAAEQASAEQERAPDVWRQSGKHVVSRRKHRAGYHVRESAVPDNHDVSFSVCDDDFIHR